MYSPAPITTDDVTDSGWVRFDDDDDDDFYSDCDPIYSAVLIDCASYLKESLEAKKSPDGTVPCINTAYNEHSLSPFHAAFSFGSTKAIEILMAYGADVLVKDCFGAVPVSYALTDDHWDLFRNFINKTAETHPDKVDVMLNTLTADRITPLHHAARRNDVEMINFLISRGARAFPDSSGRMPSEVCFSVRAKNILLQLEKGDEKGEKTLPCGKRKHEGEEMKTSAEKKASDEKTLSICIT